MIPASTWKSVNWLKPSSRIAEDIGCNEQTVRNARKRLNAPAPIRKWRPPPEPKYDWESVDWSMQDLLISKELGCSRERVRQVRRSLGRPDPLTKKWLSSTYQIVACMVKANGLPVNRKQLAVCSGSCVTRRTADRIERVIGDKILEPPPYVAPRKYPYDQFNWELSSTDLARIWMPQMDQKVARINISELRAGKPGMTLPKQRSARWDLRIPGHRTDPERIAAVSAEELKAHNHRITQAGKSA